MNPQSFDQSRANALLHRIGSEIVSSRKYVEYEWVGIALVINLYDQTSQFGYVYTRDDWEARTPGPATLRSAQEWRDAMRVSGKEPWKKALIRITRATGKIDVEFDYKGDQWRVDPADPGDMARRLRPEGL